MATKPRLSNNVIWCLEDAMALAAAMWEDLDRGRARAERLEDVRMLGVMARCMERTAGIEHHLRMGRAGRYVVRGSGSGEQGGDDGR